MFKASFVAFILLWFAGSIGAAEPRDAGGELVLSVSVEQLGWMAYGAPIQTLMALGCQDQARSVEQMFALADSVQLVGNLLGVAAVASLGFQFLEFELQLGAVTVRAQVGAALASAGASAVAEYLRWRERHRARTLAMEIARLYLQGEETCFQPRR